MKDQAKQFILKEWKKKYKNVKHVHILRAKRAERAESFLPPFSPLNARCINKSKLSKAPHEAAVAQPFLHVYSEILVRFSPCEAIRKVSNIFGIFCLSRQIAHRERPS